MNLKEILGDVVGVVGDVLHVDIIKQAGNAIKGHDTTPEELAKLDTALQQFQLAMRDKDIEELKLTISESIAEISSADKFVARARPFGLYCASILTIAVGVALICGRVIDTGAIVTVIGPMWMQGAWYTYNRTKEKLA